MHRPRHVLLLTDDQHRFDCYGATGVYPGLETPHLDRLRREGTTLSALSRRLKKATASSVVMTVGDGGRRIERAAVCVGAAGRLPLEKPRSAGCDVIVTGEMRHHDALTILRNDRTAIALGHWESERPVLAVLGDRLRKALPGVKMVISKRDRGPFGRV